MKQKSSFSTPLGAAWASNATRLIAVAKPQSRKNKNKNQSKQNLNQNLNQSKFSLLDKLLPNFRKKDDSNLVAENKEDLLPPEGNKPSSANLLVEMVFEELGEKEKEETAPIHQEESLNVSPDLQENQLQRADTGTHDSNIYSNPQLCADLHFFLQNETLSRKLFSLTTSIKHHRIPRVNNMKNLLVVQQQGQQNKTQTVLKAATTTDDDKEDDDKEDNHNDNLLDLVLLNQIGQGGFGRVYSCCKYEPHTEKDRILSPNFALKISKTANPERLQREAKVLKHLYFTPSNSSNSTSTSSTNKQPQRPSAFVVKHFTNEIYDSNDHYYEDPSSDTITEVVVKPKLPNSDSDISYLGVSIMECANCGNVEELLFYSAGLSYVVQQMNLSINEYYNRINNQIQTDANTANFPSPQEIFDSIPQPQRVKLQLLQNFYNNGASNSSSNASINNSSTPALCFLSVCERLFLQMTAALEWLHLKKVVHMDVKLENFLVFVETRTRSSSTGISNSNSSSSPSSDNLVLTVKLTDFGEARVLDTTSASI